MEKIQLIIFFVFICSITSYSQHVGEFDTALKTIGSIVVKNKKYLVLSNNRLQSQLKFKKPIIAYLLKDTLNQKTKKNQKNDTIKTRTKLLTSYYFSIVIKDKLELVNRINKDQSLIAYAKTQSKTQIVTEMKFTTTNSSFLKKKVETITLVELITKEKKQFLKLEDNNKKMLIPLEMLKPLELTYSYLCWGIVDKKNVEIVDIVQNKCDCPKSTYTSFSKAEDSNTIDLKKFIRL